MKNNNYETPAIEVVEIEVEDAVLSGSAAATNSLTAGYGGSFS